MGAVTTTMTQAAELQADIEISGQCVCVYESVAARVLKHDTFTTATMQSASQQDCRHN